MELRLAIQQVTLVRNTGQACQAAHSIHTIAMDGCIHGAIAVYRTGKNDSDACMDVVSPVPVLHALNHDAVLRRCIQQAYVA